MTDPTDKDLAKRHAAALDYDLAKADVLERLKFQASFAETGWRSLTLVNGGAIVALFTFIGNAGPSVDESLIWTGFFFFVVGLGSNIVSILGGFLAQAFYMKATTSIAWNKQAEMHGYQPPFAKVQQDEERTGDRWEILAIAAAVLSLIAFVAGASCALAGVTVSPSREVSPIKAEAAPGIAKPPVATKPAAAPPAEPLSSRTGRT